MRLVRPALAGAVLLCFALQPAVQAASPSSGTLSKSKRSVKWGGSFTLSQPDSVGACFGGATDPVCDHYMLKVDLPDGARVRVELPAPSAVDDIDVFVFSPLGSEVGRSANASGEKEIVEFRHSGRYRNKVYEVRIKPWLVVPGTAYSATAKVR